MFTSFSLLQVYIEIENENDNVPLTEQPVYYPHVLENSSAGTRIIRLNATDDDKDSNHKISFRIISGNPEGFFAIDSTTGNIHLTHLILCFSASLSLVHSFDLTRLASPQLFDNPAPPVYVRV
jgi:hypothetical protein